MDRPAEPGGPAEHATDDRPGYDNGAGWYREQGWEASEPYPSEEYPDEQYRDGGYREPELTQPEFPERRFPEPGFSEPGPAYASPGFPEPEYGEPEYRDPGMDPGRQHSLPPSVSGPGPAGGVRAAGQPPGSVMPEFPRPAGAAPVSPGTGPVTASAAASVPPPGRPAPGPVPGAASGPPASRASLSGPSASAGPVPGRPGPGRPVSGPPIPGAAGRGGGPLPVASGPPVRVPEQPPAGDNVYRSRRPAAAVLFGVIAGSLGVPVLWLLRAALTADVVTAGGVVAAVCLLAALPLAAVGLYAVATGAVRAAGPNSLQAWLRPPVAYLTVAMVLVVAAGLAA